MAKNIYEASTNQRESLKNKISGPMTFSKSIARAGEVKDNHAKGVESLKSPSQLNQRNSSSIMLINNNIQME
jgi:hypothetical protein